MGRVQRFIHRQMRRKTRVYLRPTIAGNWWLGTLLILFLIGWGYSNNLCLAIAMLVLSMTMVFLLEAHFNLDQLKLERFMIEDQFATREAKFRLSFMSRKKNTRRQLVVEWDGPVSVHSSSVAGWEGLRGEVQGTMKFSLRGHHRAEYLRLTSTYPLGLFKAWSYHRLTVEAWAYPQLVKGKAYWDGESADTDNAQLRSRGDGEEPGEFRRYALGDPMGRVAWKVLARGLPAHTKLFESPQTERRIYRWPWGQGLEEERGILAAAIQQSCEENETWLLETPHGRVDWGDDSSHRQRGLRLLSEDHS